MHSQNTTTNDPSIESEILRYMDSRHTLDQAKAGFEFSELCRAVGAVHQGARIEDIGNSISNLLHRGEVARQTVGVGRKYVRVTGAG